MTKFKNYWLKSVATKKKRIKIYDQKVLQQKRMIIVLSGEN